MGQTQCRRCGGQISTNSTTCPWCGHATTFNVVGPILLLILLGTGLSFALGFLRWEWLERTLGLDRGFIQQVQTADAGGGGGGGGGGGDLTWRLPPGPDPAENQGAVRGSRGGRAPVAVVQPVVPPARVASVARSGRQAGTLPGSPGCADSSAVARLISRYPGWSDSDLGLIACGTIRSGFSAEQVRASLGEPATISTAGPGRQQWRYTGLTVLVEQGRVISYGQ